jgi:hypothetical protein
MRRELYPRLAPDKPADAQLDEASEWEPIPVEEMSAAKREQDRLAKLQPLAPAKS